MTHSESSRPRHHPLFDSRLRPAGDNRGDDDDDDSELLDLTLLWHRRSHLHRQRSLAAASKVSSCGHYIRPGANQKPKERCDGQVMRWRVEPGKCFQWTVQILMQLTRAANSSHSMCVCCVCVCVCVCVITLWPLPREALTVFTSSGFIKLVNFSSIFFFFAFPTGAQVPSPNTNTNTVQAALAFG